MRMPMDVQGYFLLTDKNENRVQRGQGKGLKWSLISSPIHNDA